MMKSNSISVLVAVILDKVSVYLADFYDSFLICGNVYWKANPRKL